MSHPYDAATKYLVQTRLADWLPLGGFTTTAPVELVDADLATVTAAADRVLCVQENPPWLFHLELQSSRDPRLPRNLLAYNALLDRQHGLLVRTVVVLLRRGADAPELNGGHARAFPGESPYLVFHYHVARVWQLPVETFLGGGLGVLPLAPLSDITEPDLPGVIARMRERVEQEAAPEEAGELWTATDVLMGLRYPRDLVARLLQGVQGMKESVTYQAILEEGKIEGRIEGKNEGMTEGKIETQRKVLLRLGVRRFGSPTPEAQATLSTIANSERLDRLIERLLDVSSWEELLATP